MSDVFNAEEILEIAAQLERNGARFYRRAAELTTDPGAKALFTSLAQMEDEHEGVFAKFVDPQARARLFGEADEEVVQYLRALAGGRLFQEDETAALSAGMSVADILRRAIAIEKEAIAYYQALREVVPSDLGRDQIEALVREEMRHVTLLTVRLEALGAKPD